MKVYKMAGIDLALGTWKKVRYLIFAVVCAFTCVNFEDMVTYAELPGGTQLSLADVLAYTFRGTEPMIRKIVMEEFFIPPVWLVLMLLCLLMPLDYPVRSMEGWGSQYLIRADRRKWWSAKCIYTLGVNVLTLMLAVFIMSLFCLIKGMPLSMNNSTVFYEGLFGSVTGNFHGGLSGVQNFLLVFVLPLAGISAMSMIQLFVAVWVNPFVAYLVSMGMLVLSVYDNKPWLLANHMMAMRSVLIDKEGISPVVGIAWCLAICIFIFVTGLLLVKKKDMLVFKKEEV